MISLQRPRLLAVVFASLLSAGAFGGRLQGADLIWSAPVTISGDADVLAGGTGRYAWDLSNAVTTVNGVSFAAGNSTTALASDVTLSGFDAINNSTFGGGTANPWNSLSASYRSALQGAVVNSSGAAATITLNGLTTGRTYVAQVWVNDSRAGVTTTRTATATGVNSVVLAYNSQQAEGGLGQYALGWFTADAATQQFTLQAGAGSSTQINALQVRDVTNLGRWTGTGGGTWDAASTVNFATNLADDPLAEGTFAAAAPLARGVVFADAYFDAGSPTAVSQTAVTVAAGGVSTGMVSFENATLAYSLSSADSSGITGSTSLAKTGGGTLTLAGPNTFTGPATVAAGTLVLGDSLALQNAPLTLGGSGSLVFDAAVGSNAFTLGGLAGTRNIALANNAGTPAAVALTLGNGGASGSHSGVLSGAGSLTKTGAGTQTLSGNNSFTGGTTISAGTLAITSAGGLGTGPTSVAAGAALNLSAGAVNYTGLSSATAGALSGSGTVNVSLGGGSATTTLNGNYSEFTGTWNIGVGAGPGAGKVQMIGAMNAATTINVLPNATLFIANAGRFASAVLFGGDTGESLGQLRIDGADWSGPVSIAGAITGAGDAHIGSYSGTGTVSGVISGAVPLVVMSREGFATLVFSAANTHTGSTSLVSGTLRLANVAALQHSTLAGDAGGVEFQTITSATLGGLAGGRSLALANTSAAAVALSVGNNGGNTVYSGSLSGAGSLTKIGAGALSLSGTNSYAGGTTVSAGVLGFGSAAAIPNWGSASAVTVAAGAALAVGNDTTPQAAIEAGYLDPASGIGFDTSAGNRAFADVLAGTRPFVKTGANVLTLSGANTYEATSTLFGGSVELGVAQDGTTSGPLGASGTIAFAGGSLRYSAANQTDYSPRFSSAAGQAYAVDTNGQSVTWAADIASSGGSLTKSGAGTLTLSGASTYDGTTSITGGTLALGSTGAVGTSGTISFGGGRLQFSAANTTDYSARFSTAAGQAYFLDTNGQSVTLASSLTSVGGSLTKSGAGTLVLSGTNTYSGGTTVSAGTLDARIAPSSALGSGGASIAADAMLVLRNLSTAGDLTIGNAFTGGGTLDLVFASGGNARNTNMSGLAGFGGVLRLSTSAESASGDKLNFGSTTPAALVIGNGTTLYSNGNANFQGGITISGTGNTEGRGAIRFNNTVAGNITLAGDTMVGAESNGTLTGTIASGAAGSQTLTFAGLSNGNATLNGVVGGGPGTINVVQNRAGGTLTLTAANTFDGTMTVSAGTVRLSNSLAAQNATLVTGGSVVFDQSVASREFTLGGLSGSGSVALQNNAGTPAAVALSVGTNGGNTLYSGSLSGAGSLTKIGGGTLVLSGTNSYAGGTTVSAGVLGIASTAAIPGWGSAGAVTVAAGGALAVGNDTTPQAAIDLGYLDPAAGIGFDTSAGNRTFADVLAGTRPFFKTGANVLTLAAANTYAATSTLFGGSVELGVAQDGTTSGPLGGSGTIAFAGGGLRYSAANQTDYSDRFSTAAGQAYAVDTNGQSVTWATPLASSGGSLAKSGAGTLILTADATFAGPTTISAGTLALGDGGTGGTVAGPIANAGALVVNRSDAVTLAGPISGSGSLTKQAAGTLTLSGANSFTGGTSLAGGTLAISSAANLGSPSGAVLVNFTGNARLQVNGDVTTSKEFTSIGGSRSMTFDIAAGATLVANGNIRAFSGAGTVTKTGPGTLVLGADNIQLDTGLTLSQGTVDVRNIGGIGNVVSDPVLASQGTTLRLTFDSAAAVTGRYQANGTATNLVVDRVTAGPGLTTSLNSFVINGGHTVSVAAGDNVTSGTAEMAFLDGTTLNGNAVIDVVKPASAGMRLSLGSVTGSNRSLTIQGSGDTVIDGAITTGSGALTMAGSGSLTLAAANSYSGGTTVSAGTLVVGDADALGSAAATLASGATLDLAGLAVANAITNTGGLLVNAGGYTGSQTVAGPAVFTGTVGGSLTVGAGGVLKGSGVTFTGPVLIAAGGSHAPGLSPGSETFSGGLSYDASSSLVWELSANTAAAGDRGTLFDAIDVTGGNLSIAAGATLDLVFNAALADGSPSTVAWSDPFWDVDRSWTVIDFSSPAPATSSGLFTLGSVGLDSLGQPLSAGRGSFSVGRVGDDVVLNYVAVPEPAALGWAAIVALAAGAAGRGLRRR